MASNSDIYQRIEHKDHVLLRPDSYVGKPTLSLLPLLYASTITEFDILDKYKAVVRILLHSIACQ